MLTTGMKFSLNLSSQTAMEVCLQNNSADHPYEKEEITL